MYKLTRISLVIAIGFFTQCTGKGTASKDKDGKDTLRQDTVKTVTQKEPVKIDTFLTDISRVIAGMPTITHFKDSVNLAITKNYAAQTEKDYQKLVKDKIAPIRKWIVDQKIAEGKEDLTLFYPFAGADFIYANSFFPKAKNLILIGLEPAGSIQDYGKMTTGEKENYLFHIFNSLGVSNEHGFFRTNSMKVDFNQKNVNGTVHAILYYMARSGHNIVSVKNFEIDTLTGKPVYMEPQQGKKKPYGVEVVFTDSTNELKNLYYMSYDIWDPNLEKKMELFKFLDSFGKFNVFLKAASYLCAYPGYKLVREYMLNNAQYVVQDDSGIPYKYFTADKWDVTLYGNFTRVIGLFHNYNQPDLAKAYKDLKEKRELPFFIGYNTAIGESNIQYAKRK